MCQGIYILNRILLLLKEYFTAELSITSDGIGELSPACVCVCVCVRI